MLFLTFGVYFYVVVYLKKKDYLSVTFGGMEPRFIDSTTCKTNV